MFAPAIHAFRRLLRTSLPAVLGLLLSACDSLAYYSQLGRGQLQLLQARQSVASLIASPATETSLRQRLILAQQARSFASERLGLPDNGSYRQYVDLQRPFVVWNLFATTAFSLEPELHCFPIAGCVAYRGYYEQGRARGAAALLEQQGMDTYLGGVEAYSTLGWFDDPVLSSMLHWSDDRLVSIIFHELAHQRVYLAGDTAFNESYASFVEHEGLRQWRQSRGLAAFQEDHEQPRRQFVELVLDTRQRLQKLYASHRDAATLRAGKEAEFVRLRRDYAALRAGPWRGVGYYDNWIKGPLNNAKLLPFGLYDQWQPAFAELFKHAQENWPDFYRRVAELANLPVSQRQAQLQALLVVQPSGKQAEARRQ
jgi:predicted aminopeptidase